MEQIVKKYAIAYGTSKDELVVYKAYRNLEEVAKALSKDRKIKSICAEGYNKFYVISVAEEETNNGK